MVNRPTLNYILKYSAQKKICKLWFIASFLVIILFVVFSITNRFGDQTIDAWQWILQQLLPILTLIAGVFINTSEEKIGDKKVKRFTYQLAFWSSIGYFLLLALTILAMPFAYQFSSLPGYEFLDQSSVYLLPILAIVTPLLGIFFTAEAAEKDKFE